MHLQKHYIPSLCSSRQLQVSENTVYLSQTWSNSHSFKSVRIQCTYLRLGPIPTASSQREYSVPISDLVQFPQLQVSQNTVYLSQTWSNSHSFKSARIQCTYLRLGPIPTASSQREYSVPISDLVQFPQLQVSEYFYWLEAVGIGQSLR